MNNKKTSKRRSSFVEKRASIFSRTTAKVPLLAKPQTWVEGRLVDDKADAS